MKDYEEIYLYPSDIEQDEDDFYYDRNNFIEIINEEIEFPVRLVAKNSNWRGKDGFSEADNAEELIRKAFSFGNDEISFRKNDEGYYIRTNSHDVPMGFNIYIEEV